jgi:hypothetical protein
MLLISGWNLDKSVPYDFHIMIRLLRLLMDGVGKTNGHRRRLVNGCSQTSLPPGNKARTLVSSSYYLNKPSQACNPDCTDGDRPRAQTSQTLPGPAPRSPPLLRPLHSELLWSSCAFWGTAGWAFVQHCGCHHMGSRRPDPQLALACSGWQKPLPLLAPVCC